MKKTTESVKLEQGKLESMKTSAVTARLKGDDLKKLEIETVAQTTKITELEQQQTRDEAAVIEYKDKVTQLKNKRKEIKFEFEVKVLEAKEAE